MVLLHYAVAKMIFIPIIFFFWMESVFDSELIILLQTIWAEFLVNQSKINLYNEGEARGLKWL
jgi:hypothetical protein